MSEVSLDKMGHTSADVSGDKTLAATDIGTVQNVTVDGKVITLPATVVGYAFTIRVADAGVGVSVSPNASDKIAGLGFTATDNKDLILAASDARPGDFLSLVGDGVNGYMVVAASGNWTQEA